MVMRIGHRGAAGTAPENTLASMRRALALGVDGIEFDIHRSKDGALVVIHDPTLDRTTNGTGTIAELTLDEIRDYDAGSWKGPEFTGERIPTLSELVRAVPAPARLFLELKAGSSVYPDIEVDLARFLQRNDLLDRVQVSSFDHFALRRLRELLPYLQTGMLYSCKPIDPISMARACGASALHPNWTALSPELVASSHQAGLPVNVWTPNTEAAIAYCLELGVDGIITDYPERLDVALSTGHAEAP